MAHSQNVNGDYLFGDEVQPPNQQQHITSTQGYFGRGHDRGRPPIQTRGLGRGFRPPTTQDQRWRAPRPMRPPPPQFPPPGRGQWRDFNRPQRPYPQDLWRGPNPRRPPPPHCAPRLGRPPPFRAPPPELPRERNSKAVEMTSTEALALCSKLTVPEWWNNKEQIRRDLTEGLQRLSINPYEFLLAFLTRQPGYEKATKKQNHFLVFILQTFKDLAAQQKFQESGLITKPLQLLAFEKFWFVESIPILKEVANIFNLREIIPTDLKPYLVKGLSNQSDWIAACCCIAALEIQDQFDAEATTIPLWLSLSGEPLRHSFINSSKLHQTELLKWLDSLIDKRTREIQMSKYLPFVGVVHLERFEGKALENQIKKYVKEFNLDSTVTPNFYQTSKSKAFAYLLRQRRELRLENWRDLIERQLAEDPTLSEMLFSRLRRDQDIEEIMEWSKRLNVSISSLGGDALLNQVSQFEARTETWDDSSSTRSYDSSRLSSTADDGNQSEDGLLMDQFQFLKLDVCVEKIQMIDTLEKFDQFLEKIKSEYIIGLDLEFAPRMISQAREMASILQLATAGPEGDIFILDMAQLVTNGALPDQKLSDFVNDFFICGSHLILGYGLNGDLQTLANTHSLFRDIILKSDNLLDLDWFSKLLASGTSKILSLPHETHKKGLSGLTEMVLGKPLDKSDQISLWDRRPLTTEQLRYAALDAKVLIQIYQELQTMAEASGAEAEFSKLEVQLRRNKNKPPSQKKTAQTKALLQNIANMPPINRDVPINIGDLKVSCDSMLQGLCKRLQSIGMDAVIIQPFEHFSVCGEVANKERRMIITKGAARSSDLQKYVPRGAVLSLKSDKVDEQVKEVVQYFNVRDGDDITICESCNSQQIMALPKEILMKISTNLIIANLRNPSSTAQSNHQTYYMDDDDYDDYASNDSDDDGPMAALPAAASQTNVEDWQKVGEIEIDLQSGRLREDGVQLAVDAVPKQILSEREDFFACIKCGHVMWRAQSF